MANERIRKEMLLAGVSITELAERMGLDENQTVAMLNTDLGIMQSFTVMSAVCEIVSGKKESA